MKLYVPNDDEIREAAVRFGIITDPRQAITAADRSRIARALSDAHAAEEAAQREQQRTARQQPAGRVLSQTSTETSDGVLVVLVTLYPKENRADVHQPRPQDDQPPQQHQEPPAGG